jgi:hypothetical protein
VGVVIRLRVEDLGVVVCFSAGTRDISFFKTSRPALGPTQFPFQWVPVELPPGLKELDVKPTTHLHPTCAEGKNEWSYTSLPSYALMLCKGINVPFLFRLIARSVSAGLSWLVSGSYWLVILSCVHKYL